MERMLTLREALESETMLRLQVAHRLRSLADNYDDHEWREQVRALAAEVEDAFLARLSEEQQSRHRCTICGALHDGEYLAPEPGKWGSRGPSKGV